MSNIPCSVEKIMMQRVEENFALKYPLAFAKFLFLIISRAYGIQSHLIFLFDADTFNYDNNF